MGWLERCYQTYEKNLAQVGKPSASIRYGWDAPMLLPVAHTTQKVNVELSLTADGEFCTARVLRSDEMTTVIPCTEESSARTSGAVPHPLVDKLQYIAGDYTTCGGTKKPMWGGISYPTAGLVRFAIWTGVGAGSSDLSEKGLPDPGFGYL